MTEYISELESHIAKLEAKLMQMHKTATKYDKEDIEKLVQVNTDDERISSETNQTEV